MNGCFELGAVTKTSVRDPRDSNSSLAPHFRPRRLSRFASLSDAASSYALVLSSVGSANFFVFLKVSQSEAFLKMLSENDCVAQTCFRENGVDDGFSNSTSRISRFTLILGMFTQETFNDLTRPSNMYGEVIAFGKRTAISDEMLSRGASVLRSSKFETEVKQLS